MNVKQNENSLEIENNGSTIVVDGAYVRKLCNLLYKNEPVIEIDGENMPSTFTQPYKVGVDCFLIKEATWGEDYVLKVFLNKKTGNTFTVWKYFDDDRYHTRNYSKIKKIISISVKSDYLEVEV